MATITHLTDRRAVLRAIAEHDRLGEDAFLSKYRYGPARTWVLLHGGEQYPSKAIAGAAVLFQHGRRPTHLNGGIATVVPRLTALGFDVRQRRVREETAALPEELRGKFEEGRGRQITVDKYERSAAARAECLKVRGTACLVCGFEGSARYGVAFADLIHVHHLRPFSRHRGKRTVDPRTDLVPVCPNCHAAIHYAGKTRGIEQMRRIVRRRRLHAS